MTDDQQPTPAKSGRERLAEAIEQHGPLMPAPALPERPVEVVVEIEHEDGMAVAYRLELTREQGAQPEILGAAVGSVAASALSAYYVEDRGTGAADARDAAAVVLSDPA